MSNKGSAIIWVVSTLLIFMIVVTGIMALVGGSHKSALRNNYKQQAYFTALSAVRAVAEGIKQAEDFPIPANKNASIKATVNLPEDSMGNSEVFIERENDNEILITAEGNYQGVKDTVSLRLTSEGGIWKAKTYER